MSWKQVLFSFQGRVGRKAFWLTMLVSVVIGILAQFLVIGAVIASGKEPSALVMVPLLVAGIALIWISLAIQAKRWHDQDKSAWWILVNLVPAVGGLVTLIMCGFLQGTPGPNRFGAMA